MITITSTGRLRISLFNLLKFVMRQARGRKHAQGRIVFGRLLGKSEKSTQQILSWSQLSGGRLRYWSVDDDLVRRGWCSEGRQRAAGHGQANAAAAATTRYQYQSGVAVNRNRIASGAVTAVRACGAWGKAAGSVSAQGSDLRS
jgi:hypothetical protein